MSVFVFQDARSFINKGYKTEGCRQDMSKLFAIHQNAGTKNYSLEQL